MQLTPNERQLLDAIAQGMDSPGCGWLHEVTPFRNDHVCAGVLGSLITKGLVASVEDNEGPMTCYFVRLTPRGRALFPTVEWED